MEIKLIQKDIAQYTISITSDINWISYRHPNYNPSSVSYKENRFNNENEVAYYVASGDFVARQEVNDYATRKKYIINPGIEFKLFDLISYSIDYNLKDCLTKPKNEDGYKICQEVAKQLKDNFSITGILYSSSKMKDETQSGICVAILPLGNALLDENIFKEINS